MIKILCIAYACTMCVSGGHIGRVMTVSRMRVPSAFRPGVSINRPWAPPPPRLVQAASHRAPYVLYRSPSGHRYVRPYMSNGMRGYLNNPWRTTAKLPSPVTPEYEFVKAASASPSIFLQSDGGTGAIHTIPAPNLSLSEKPIVVMDSSDDIISSHTIKTDAIKPGTYQLTEKIPNSHNFHLGKHNYESPALLGLGLSKATSLTGPELSSFVKNGAALHLAAEYGMPAISVPQTQVHIPQQFTLQGFNGLLQDPTLQVGAESNIQNLMFQPDQMFLQKLQNQLYQRFPGVEFIPYQPEPEPQTQLYLVNTEDTKKPSTEHKNVVRETQEAAVVTLVPQTLVVNVTENQIPVEVISASTEPQNVTYALVTTETQSPSTTVKYILETTTEQDKTTPIYYAQVGQSVGNVIANGFYSAINDVRAAAESNQVEKPQQEINSANDTVSSTTTVNPEIKAYVVKTDPQEIPNQTITELKPLRGVPFSKVEPVNVAYTLVRTDDSKPKVTKNGAVYAGQIVEASVSEDQDYIKEKASLHARHPPLRLIAVNDNKETTTSVAPKLTVVKAKIPPKSKLTFDDKTGEPVLRIYASYVDSPLQKEALASKLSSIKHVKEILVRKQDSVDNWKSSSMKNLDKPQSGSDVNQVTEFGLKLRPRMDDYVALFDDYES